jgi:two-component sensor histidine kinase/PAS domain-containing protein
MSTTPPTPLAGRQVLVVEDEVILAWALDEMVSDLGGAVIGPAARVAQALELIRENALDAAILDVNLSGEKCYALADELVARGVPFLFATAYSHEGIPPRYQGHPRLQKPFTRQELGQAMAALLARGPVRTMVWDAAHLRIATDSAGLGLWSWDVDTDLVEMDAQGQALWEVPGGEVTFETLSTRVHPEDLDRVRAAFHAARDAAGASDVDFRIRAGDGGGLRWVSARGRGDGEGRVGRRMFGVFLDMTARKQAEEARALLADEMEHRIHNLFAVAASLARISARSTTSTALMAEDLRLRLDALGRAQRLARLAPGDGQAVTLLPDLLCVLLAAYAEQEGGARLLLDVPPLPVGEGARAALALIIHELATNAIKHGALSVEHGSLSLAAREEAGWLILTWREAGGPPVAATPRPGFGQRLVEQSVNGRLGGDMAQDWAPGGLVITLRLARERLAA